MKVLVTGGGGFLGAAIVRSLLARGEQVTSISRHHHATLDGLNVREIQGDVSDPVAVGKAMQGCELVFHVAAKAGVWGSLNDYYQVNVEGTRNLIESCRKHQVKRLVFTSSPSVIFDGRDQDGWDESAVYPKKYLAHYPYTKALAEQLVIKANGSDLATVSLRPHLIWGPGDNHLVPRIVRSGRIGRIRMVGKPNKWVDSVYIDNAAEAHLLAGDLLSPGCAISGKNYFITNDEPMPMLNLINGILSAADVAPVERSIPAVLAYGLGFFLECYHRIFARDQEPVMTRFVARQLATSHYYDISAAKKDLRYIPKISIEEGFLKLRAELRKHPIT